MALAKFMKNWPAPDFSRNAPKMMNRTTYEPATPSGMPKSPSLVKNVWSIRISYVSPLWRSTPGSQGPTTP